MASISKSVFNRIKILEITGDIKYISQSLFQYYSSLTQITIHSSVTSIENNALFSVIVDH